MCASEEARIMSGFRRGGAALLVVAVALLNGGALLPGVAHARVLGTIDFGTNYKDNGSIFTIVGAKKTFGPGERIAYIAHIPGGPGTKHMTVAFYASTGATMSLVSNHPWDVTTVTDTEFANRYTRSDMADYGIVRPGRYTMRFLNHGTVLAQGWFKRT
jgi:hypothetical protein